MPGPGVVVDFAVRPGSSGGAVPASARVFIVGRCERGSTTVPILVRSLSEFVSKCGSRQSYGSVYDAVRLYFAENPAGELYIARIVGDSAVAGTITLVDRAGTPVNTISVTALSKGAWANGWTVTVAAGTISGTVTLTLKDASGNVMETFPNKATVAEIAASTSAYVTFANLNSATAAPNNLPAVATSTLASGAESTFSDVGASLVAALERFTRSYGAGVVIIPGYAADTASGASTIAAGLDTHCRANRRIWYSQAASGASYATAVALRATLASAVGERGGLIWPWVISRDGTTNRTLSPDGYAAACRARAHELRHPGRVPAGVIAASKSGLVPEFDVTDEVGTLINDAGVSVVRIIGGQTQLYGYRSLSTDEVNYRTLNRADVANTLSYDLAAQLQSENFEDIDGLGQLQARVKGKLEGRLKAIQLRGGLFVRRDPLTKRVVDPGYAVDVETLNTLESLATDTLRVIVYFRPSPSAELIALTLTLVGLTATIAA